MVTLKEDWKVASKKRKIDFVILIASMLICGCAGIYSALLFLFSAWGGYTDGLYCLGAGIMCGLLWILSRHKIAD